MRRTIALALCLFVVSIGSSASTHAAPTPTDSGIRGRVVLGPLTPSTQVGRTVREQPFQATLDIVKSDESLVVQIRTRRNGWFVVALEPGDYLVRSAPSDETLKRPSIEPVEVTVPPHEYVDVTITADTGIR